ncbi:MAG: GNAT family N-acetyltransferase [Nitrospirota bacterium]|nr:GNAT family N-acetyltransferase [Nitrospirota bacterium]
MPTIPVKIRPMNKNHIAACDDIVRTSEPWKTLRERVDFSAAIRSKQVYVALIEGAVAGFVIFTAGPVFARGGYLRALGVAPAIRGLGIGRQLMKFAEKTAVKQSQNFFLCVSSFNKPGQLFYKSLGYAKAGKLDNLIKQGVSELIYWKRLK